MKKNDDTRSRLENPFYDKFRLAGAVLRSIALLTSQRSVFKPNQPFKRLEEAK